MIYDYLIVGTGPSGGTIAYHLQKSGAKCAILEAGKFYRKDTFPRNEADTSALLYWGGGIEFSADAKMGFLRSRLVGGTSIVNQCLLDRFDDIAWNDWKNQSGVDYFGVDAMKQYYDEVEANLTMHTFEPKDRNPNAQAFVEACDKLGYKWDNLRKGQSDCALNRGNDCMACLGGCHRDSKQSSMVTFMQKAEREKIGLDIITETMVDRVEHSDSGVKVYAKQNGKEVVFQARYVVLAGGSFGTTQIMLKSGYGKQLPALGKYFSSHPQYMSFGIFDEIKDAHRGYFQTVASKDPNFRNIGFKLENVFAPPISYALLFQRSGNWHHEMMKKYRYTTCIEVAVRDENNGVLTLNKSGGLVINKPLSDVDKIKRDKGLEVVKNILHAEGAKEIYQAPFYFGLHLMGGCVIGTDPKTSVVDPDFRVHGLKNIFIADSSIYPNAPGINPSLTIIALSKKLSNQLTQTTHAQVSEQLSA